MPDTNKSSTGIIRALPDDAPEPAGERIPYKVFPYGRLFVYVDTVISNAAGPLVWWRGNFYEEKRNA
jgi:hypothetical protein